MKVIVSQNTITFASIGSTHESVVVEYYKYYNIALKLSSAKGSLVMGKIFFEILNVLSRLTACSTWILKLATTLPFLHSSLVI